MILKNLWGLNDIKIKCEGCGARISDENTRCTKCGYVLYQSEFESIAKEVRCEMDNLPESELSRGKKETGYDDHKLSYIEFEKKYIFENRISYPSEFDFRAASVLRRLVIDKEIKRAYKMYMTELGY